MKYQVLALAFLCAGVAALHGETFMLMAPNDRAVKVEMRVLDGPSRRTEVISLNRDQKQSFTVSGTTLFAIVDLKGKLLAIINAKPGYPPFIKLPMEGQMLDVE